MKKKKVKRAKAKDKADPSKAAKDDLNESIYTYYTERTDASTELTQQRDQDMSIEVVADLEIEPAVAPAAEKVANKEDEPSVQIEESQADDMLKLEIDDESEVVLAPIEARMMFEQEEEEVEEEDAASGAAPEQTVVQKVEEKNIASDIEETKADLIVKEDVAVYEATDVEVTKADLIVNEIVAVCAAADVEETKADLIVNEDVAVCENVEPKSEEADTLVKKEDIVIANEEIKEELAENSQSQQVPAADDVSSLDLVQRNKDTIEDSASTNVETKIAEWSDDDDEQTWSGTQVGYYLTASLGIIGTAAVMYFCRR